MRIYTLLPMLIGLIATATLLPAQQTPFLNHYTWNPRLFNPAGQGGADGGEIALVYRNQFQQLDASVRPSSYLLHADASSFLNERIGLAVQLLGDKAHVLNRFQLSGFFAYHLVQNNQIRLSLGAAVGYLNQNFDFNGVRISDMQDLNLLDNRVNAARFDGGPGLTFEYRLPAGSFFALDAAATQLFSSDISIRESTGSTTDEIVYDIIPHLLVNSRFRIQATGFAIEPNVAFRALSGPRPLKAGVFDFNLNAYFLKDNRLMVGTGMRTNGGGVHLQVGVAPARNTRINFSAEIHPSLGTTFEIGAGYTLDRRRPKADLLEDPYREAKEIASILDVRVSSLRTQQDAIGNAIGSSAAARDLRQRATAADQCAALLTQTEREINNLRSSANMLEAKRLEAEKIVRNAEIQAEDISAETRSNLAAMGEWSRQAVDHLNNLNARQRDLAQQCTALRPEISEFACIRSGDAACVQELFSTRLQSRSGNPADLFPLQTSTTPGQATLIYRFPDDEEAYALTPEIRNLATNLSSQIADLKKQGIQLDAVDLVTELQEDKSTLEYKPGLLYSADLESSVISYTLIDHKSGERATRQVALADYSEVSLEQIGVLKLATLRLYLTKLGIPANRISLTVRYNHEENLYREETQIVLRVRG